MALFETDEIIYFPKSKTISPLKIFLTTNVSKHHFLKILVNLHQIFNEYTGNSLKNNFIFEINMENWVDWCMGGTAFTTYIF